MVKILVYTEAAEIDDASWQALRDAGIKKRVQGGACPCCNRHFVQLERHMATKHPEIVGLPKKARS